MKSNWFAKVGLRVKRIKTSLLPILGVASKKRYIGTYGENLAARYLKKNCYKIKARNFVAAGAEIDIIAQNRDTLAFVEVKTRSYLPKDREMTDKEQRPASCVTPDKQKKIFAASKFYPNKNSSLHLRFDIIEVYLDEDRKHPEIMHLPNAFSIDTAYRK